MSPADFYPRQVCWDKRRRDSVFILFPDEVIGVVELKSKAKNRSNRRKRYVALFPVQTNTNNFSAIEISLTDDSSVGDRCGI